MKHEYRKDFPIFQQKFHGKPLIYLDTAATAQKPQAVIDVLDQFYRQEYGTVHRAVYALSVNATTAYEAVRSKVQQFIKAKKKEEIVFTRGTTDAINLVAASFGKAFVRSGDEILISETNHHSNIVPWQLLCEERGAKLRIIPVNDHGELQLEAYSNLLNKKTKLVALSHIDNATGTVHPIREIIAMAHSHGAKVLIDGAQSISHIPIDVQELDADFFAFSSHKIYGPTGIGVLYGKEELLNAMPPYQGGGDMIELVTLEKTTFNTLPLKFEAGTPMIAAVIGMGAAIDYVQSIGFDRINIHEMELLNSAIKQLKEIPQVKFIGTSKKKGAILSFVVDGVHPLDIGTLLDLQGIAIRTGHQCAQPTMKRFGITGTCRISFGIYNTHEDVDHFVSSLRNVIDRLSC